MTRRVVLVDDYGDVEIVRPELAGLDVVVEQQSRMPSGAGIVGLIAGPDNRVGVDALAALPDVRIVSASSTGYDHLDLAALRAAGVVATHVPGYCDEEVAEHTIAMVATLLRQLPFLEARARKGEWFEYGEAAPRRIGGSVLGIVGLGRIGREVARRALALDMRVLAYDAYLGDDVVAAAGAEARTLAALLAESDVVSLHAVLDASTRDLIDADALACMRPGSFLVNCGRAGLVDHDALGAALRGGHLAGAALDVVPNEPPRPDDPVFAFPRTLITPHAAFYSPAARIAPYQRAARAVRAVLLGDEPADRLV